MEERGSLYAPALDIPPADNIIEDVRKRVLLHHFPLMPLTKYILLHPFDRWRRPLTKQYQLLRRT